MPTCRVEKSSVPFHSNYSENCDCDGTYQTRYSFNKEQHYEGDFFRDGLHGQGTYKWNDVAVYEGGFYSNYKEGYASLSFPDSSYFEGLFIRNEPFGPGILTHANGRQDAGFWMGRKLVRLSRAVDFIIPRLAPTSAAKLKLLQFRRLIPLNETDWVVATDVLKKCGYPFDHFYSPYSSLIYDPRSVFFDMQAFEETYFVNFKEVLKGFSVKEKSWESLLGIDEELEDEENSSERLKETPIPLHCLCPQDALVMEYKDQNPIDICEERSTEGEYEMGILTYFTKFGTVSRLPKNEDEDKSEEEVPGEDIFGGAEESKIKSRPSNIVSWNRSELCTEMLKQIFRYRAFEDKLHFNLAKLMLGVRTAFRRTGIKEKECLQFLKMCSLGPGRVIKDLLCSYEISEELMDARGNNSLMFAAAADQHEVIDILLDYGVDVNTFNDENLTPLNLCLLRRLAQSNGICSWETAFLPKEIDIPASEYPQAEELEAQVSIKSLDRIFGDGMSINDSKSRILDPRLFPPFTSPKAFRDSCDGSHKAYRPSDESKDLFDLSQITILNIPKSQGSQIMIPTIHVDSSPVLRRSYSSTGFQERDECQTIRSSDATPRINIRLVPKSVKRDEFVNSLIKSDTDRYLFEISFQKNPNMVERKSDDSVKSNRRHSRTLNKAKEEPQEPEPQAVSQDPTFEISKKIEDIDKTILKLLTRGADPNISEVPKPAIHLGVYTKDLNTVYNLLSFGANPNSQLYSNEGLLTPLHVVVLQPSSREIVDICELLLTYGAQVESETQPEFSMREEEKDFLDPEKGRTPLQLLCMRPDLEYADPEGNVLRIGIMLAKDSDKRRFYNGHSYLTLAMMFGNIKLLSSFLDSRFFDPNDILEKDRGTALHVLVSRELQKKTAFNDSIKMADLLLAAGADPLKKFKSPKSLHGNCIDYGYREIQAEREARLSNTSKASKKEFRKAIGRSGREISGARDTLQDHVKVVEYLSEKALEMTQKRKHGKKRKRGSSLASEDLKTDDETTSKHKPGKDGKGRKGERVSSLSSEDVKGKKGKDDETEEGEGKKGKKGKGDDGEEGEGKKKGKKGKDDEAEEGESKKKGKKGKDDEAEEGESKKKGKKGKGDDGEEGEGKKKGKKGKGDDGEEGEGKKKRKKGKGDDGEEGEGKKKGKKGKGDETEEGEGKKKGKKGKGDDGEEEEGKKKGKKGEGDETEGVRQKGKKLGEHGTEKSKPKADKGEKGKKRKAGDDKEGEERGKRGKKNKLKSEEGDSGQKESKIGGDVKESVPKMEKESNKDLNKLRERELCLQNPSKPSFTRSSTKQLAARSETFPERLRQDLLRMYGENCINIDINQFLVPYVVLRDGELYYRFHGKKQIQKEQYSLI